MKPAAQLFLVRSRISTREYMRQGEDVREEADLVMARDATHAEEKTVLHYEQQSDSYGTSYSCMVLSVKPVIR